MKICFFSKYPPIEGGVSSSTYWISRELGEKGIEVHIVTNASEVEKPFRQKIDFSNPSEAKQYEPSNVFIHEPPSHIPSYIPFSKAYLERLVNTGIEVIGKYKCDLIDSFYIQPYGLAAVFTKLLTNKPCIVRHAGSDISRLFSAESLYYVFKEILKNADVIVTKPGMKNTFKLLNILENSLWFKTFTSANPKYFNPQVPPIDFKELGLSFSSTDLPVITYLGKYSDNKGIPEFMEALSNIKEDFLLLLVTGGKEFDQFKEKIANISSLKGKYHLVRFLPPWKVPSLLRASTCLLHLENDFPIRIHMVIQPAEALGVATPTLMSHEIFSKYQAIFPKMEENKHVFVVNPKNKEDLEKKLREIIKNPEIAQKVGEQGHQDIFEEECFNTAVENQIALYKSLLENKNLFEKIFGKK